MPDLSRTGEAMENSSQEFAKTAFTKTGRPKMGTTITLHLDNGEWEDATVVAHLMGKGPEGRQGLVGIIVEFASDKERVSLEWPLVRDDHGVAT